MTGRDRAELAEDQGVTELARKLGRPSCAYPGDSEHDHEMCRDALAELAEDQGVAELAGQTDALTELTEAAGWRPPAEAWPARPVCPMWCRGRGDHNHAHDCPNYRPAADPNACQDRGHAGYGGWCGLCHWDGTP